jgi:hypothetical protein
MVIIAYCGFALMPIPFIPEFFFELASYWSSVGAVFLASVKIR